MGKLLLDVAEHQVPPANPTASHVMCTLSLLPHCSPSGTWANPDLTEATTGAKGCSLCPSGQYRSGDAAPENNMCRQIPPGGELRLGTAVGHCRWGPAAACSACKRCLACMAAGMSALAAFAAHASCPAKYAPLLRHPPGYKAAATVLDAKNRIGAADIQLCSAGEVSFWSGSPAVRTPTDATTCKPCDKNSGTVAPRAGEAVCRGR